MVHASVHDRLTGFDQVVHVIHEIEIAVDGSAVLLHQPRLHLQRLEPLGGQRNAGHRAGEDLQVGVRPDCCAHLVHADKRIFAGVEVWCLIAGAAAELEMANAHRGGGLHGGKHVIDAHVTAEYTLQSVTESGQHDVDFLGGGGKDHGNSTVNGFLRCE